MSDELNDIPSDLNNEQEKLLDYLKSNLSDPERHAFEIQMNDDEFMNDAVEGLEQVNDKRNISLLAEQLNADLRRQIKKKKKKKEKRKPAAQFWTYLSIILLLILFVTAYFIIRRMG